jgi:hypothetical protein
MKPTSESLAWMLRSFGRAHHRTLVALCVTTFLFLTLADKSSTKGFAGRTSGLGQQSSPLTMTAPQMPSSRSTGANTCRCLPPIPSEASATGACTRTQDDATFCELTFSLSQRAAAVSGLATFDKYAADWNFSVSKEQISPLVDRLQEGEIAGLKPQEVADSVRAVATVAAFQRPNDAATQSHFRDIFQMLKFQGSGDEDRKATVVRSIDHFAASSAERSQEVDKIAVSGGRTYQLVTTPGCISFGEREFSFMIRATATAAPCEVPR